MTISPLRHIPALTLAVMAVPVLAGGIGTALPALRQGGAALDSLFAWPGLPRAAALSLGSGLVSTALSLGLALVIVAALSGTRAFGPIRHALTPLLSVPHAAAALGLAFLIAPSGWIARMLSPWATGWTVPPDLLILNDSLGLSLTAGLVAKELPFLLLMTLAALPQVDPARRLTTAATLGYGRIAGFALTVLPALYPLLRLPVYAVLAYAMTSVEMALILGPTLPPTLSAQVTLWMSAADLAQRDIAAAGALVQMGLVALALALWRGLEAALALALRAWSASGHRATALDRPAHLLALTLATAISGGLALGLAGLALWSLAAEWRFPDALPGRLGLATWQASLPDLTATARQTLQIAVLATLAALALSLACLEAEARFHLRPTPLALHLLYLPLIMPQVAFLPGLQALSLATGLDGTLAAVTLAHLVFVLPYVFLSLQGPFAAWNRQIGLA
ncbi:MAG: hypothetical protein RIT14_2075, partial [Pseudomonadota bacterium]